MMSVEEVKAIRRTTDKHTGTGATIETNTFDLKSLGDKGGMQAVAAIAELEGFADDFLAMAGLSFAQGREGVSALAVERELRIYLDSDEREEAVDDGSDDTYVYSDGHGSSFSVAFAGNNTMTVTTTRTLA